jgi:hypothetical protein
MVGELIVDGRKEAVSARSDASESEVPGLKLEPEAALVRAERQLQPYRDLCSLTIESDGFRRPLRDAGCDWTFHPATS